LAGGLETVGGEYSDPDDEKLKSKTALLVESGGRGASGIFDRSASSLSSCLTFGVPNIDVAGLGAPKILLMPPDGGLEPKGLNPETGAALAKLTLWGAGVVVGVVDCGLKIDLGFSSTGGGVVRSISISLDSAAAGFLAASSSESPNPLSNNGLPSFGFSLSLAEVLSALKVVPRTKGEVPSVGLSVLAAGGGKAVSVSIETSGALEVKALPGLDPKILDPPEALPRPAKPPLLANVANPPLAGEAPLLPKTLPGLAAAPGNPVWPNAGAAPLVDPAAQGDTLAPRPIPEDWPKAGAAGLLPKADVPKADAPGAAVAGLLPKGLDPNAGEADAPPTVDQGDDLAPRAEGPPKADAAADGDPNAGALVAGDANADGAAAAGAGAVKAGATASPAVIPG
jgi:hypothetical protein